VRSASVNFVDQIFNAEDVVLAKSLRNDFVVGKRNSLLIDLSVTSLVDQVRDDVSGGISIFYRLIYDAQRCNDSYPKVT